MDLRGYVPMDITPWENASNGKGIQCTGAATCRASFRFDRAAGWYDMDVEYFDQNNGESKFRVLRDDQVLAEWVADNSLPAKKPGADSSSRKRIRRIALRPGDVIWVEGTPDREEYAGIDFVEIRLSTDPGTRGGSAR